MKPLTQEAAPLPSIVPSTHQPNPPDPQKTSPLFKKLPGELRNEIIRLAIVSATETRPKITHTPTALTGRSTAKLNLEPPLMQTCKALRQESAEIFFLENSFRLADEDFFSQSPLSSDSNSNSSSEEQQRKTNSRAIKTLARAFGLWASQVRSLDVSHAICYDTTLYGNPQTRWRRVQVHLSIRRRDHDRERGSSSSAQVLEPDVYMETARAFDATSPSQQELCCCNISQRAVELGRGVDGFGLFEFAREIVRVVDEVAGQRALPHCWNCGLGPMS